MPDAMIEIGCDARFCWSLLADARLIPEWVAGVAEAEITEADADGRALRVRFVGMPSVASSTYEVAYRYDDAIRAVRWATVEGTERPIEGSARIEELDGARCRLHYALQATTPGSMPRWARDSLADDTPERVVRAFQRFAERRYATPR